MTAYGSRGIAVVAALLATLGCASMGRVHEVVNVNQRMVIGFAPPVSAPELEKNDGLSSALEHWKYGLDNAAACLKSSAIEVRPVCADTVTIVSASGRVTVEIHPSPDADGIGAYLVAPGEAARLMFLEMPSAFVHSLPGAAADTFHAEECCSETSRGMGFCSRH
jgi:hypothetical protein